jgi:hypothetical protein
VAADRRLPIRSLGNAGDFRCSIALVRQVYRRSPASDFSHQRASDLALLWTCNLLLALLMMFWLPLMLPTVSLMEGMRQGASRPPTTVPADL